MIHLTRDLYQPPFKVIIMVVFLYLTQLLKSCKDAIPKEAISNLLNTVQWGIPGDIAKEVPKVESIKGAIKLQLLQEIND